MKVLISGGSGLIGEALSKILIKKGYSINILSRSKNQNQNANIKYFQWDISSNKIDEKALENIEYIINLAGENISEKKWTDKQKIKIENSRIKSIELLYQTCLKKTYGLKYLYLPLQLDFMVHLILKLS